MARRRGSAPAGSPRPAGRGWLLARTVGPSRRGVPRAAPDRPAALAMIEPFCGPGLAYRSRPACGSKRPADVRGLAARVRAQAGSRTSSRRSRKDRRSRRTTTPRTGRGSPPRRSDTCSSRRVTDAELRILKGLKALQDDFRRVPRPRRARAQIQARRGAREATIGAARPRPNGSPGSTRSSRLRRAREGCALPEDPRDWLAGAPAGLACRCAGGFGGMPGAAERPLRRAAAPSRACEFPAADILCAARPPPAR